MKKLICVLLCSVFLMSGGCFYNAGQGEAAEGALMPLSAAAESPDFEAATEILEQVDRLVEETGGIIEEMQEIISWQIENSEREMAEAAEAKMNGEEYEYSDDSEEIKAYYDELLGCKAALEEKAAKVAGFGATGIEQVDITIVAAKEYLSQIHDALDDVLMIFDFYFAQEEALLPMSEFDYDDYRDDITAVTEMYYAVYDSSQALAAVDCPEFMRQAHTQLVRQLDIYCSIIESYYTFVVLQQYGVTDVLRYYSVLLQEERLDLQIDKYSDLQTEDFNLQYRKVRERLSGGIATLGGELSANCALLIEAMQSGEVAA